MILRAVNRLSEAGANLRVVDANGDHRAVFVRAIAIKTPAAIFAAAFVKLGVGVVVDVKEEHLFFHDVVAPDDVGVEERFSILLDVAMFEDGAAVEDLFRCGLLPKAVPPAGAGESVVVQSPSM